MDLKRIIETLKGHAGNPSLRQAALTHMAFAFIIFSPFFLGGRVLVASTDNRFTTLPNMLLNYRSFNGVDLGLWNPYILAGADFSASTQNFIFSPLNWPIFIFPERYIFLLLTLRMFIEVWLLGVFGYLFFKEEFSGDGKWALFSSTVYQLSGYMFFSITTYANLTIYLFATLALYLVWTLRKRKGYLSYIYLTLSSALIILSGNMVYSFGAILMLIVLFTYREWPSSSRVFRPSRECVIFYAGLFSGVLISMARLLPFALSLPQGDRMGAGDFPGYVDNSLYKIYLGITAFIPETFGVNYQASVPLLGRISPALQGLHAQVHGFTYFGALPALLVLFGALCMRERRLNFWLVYLMVTSLWFLDVRPVSDIIDLLFYPLKHTIIPKIMIPVGVAAASGLSGRYLEANYKEVNTRHLKILALIAALILSSALLVHVYSLPGIINAARLIVIFLFLLTAGGVYLLRRRAADYMRSGGAAFSILVPAGGILFFAAKGPVPGLAGDKFLISSLVYSVTSILSLTFLWVFSSEISRTGEREKPKPLLYFFTWTPMVFALFYPFSPAATGMSESAVRVIAFFGSLKFILVFLFFAHVITAVKSQRLDPSWLFLLFLLAVTADLLPFNKVYARQVSEPFLTAGELYPDRNYILNPRLGLQYAIGTRGCDNLIKNDSFESWGKGEAALPDAWGLGGTGPATVRKDTAEKVVGRASAAIISGTGNVMNLYQDITTQTDFSGKTFTYGAWVKASKPHQAVLLLTDSKNGAFSVYHSGKGGWEWLTVTHMVTVPSKFVRPHISIVSPGTVYADGAAVVEAPYLPPFYCNPADTGHERSSDFQDSSPLSGYWEKGMDTKNFRVNNPHILLKLSPTELETNMPSLYGVRSYGGVNSLVERRYKNFALNFTPPSSISSPGALTANIKDPRYLELMGVRYDVDEAANITIRPNALSRFMLFEDFSMSAGDTETLKILKDAGFNPRQTLILDEDPGMPLPGVKREGRDVEFTSLSSSSIDVHVKNSTPSLLFFNDSYNRGWKAYVNGKERPVIRADFNFMAVALPAGESDVVFRFKPGPFYRGAKLTASGIILFFLAGTALFIFSGRRKD
ncbi:MAG: YfhO family protein [Deltaproteobacteria bacterium]|nr:YfhO family protein [Deltaproteobacteria bacterium]